eukprot:g50520.t1
MPGHPTRVQDSDSDSDAQVVADLSEYSKASFPSQKLHKDQRLSSCVSQPSAMSKRKKQRIASSASSSSARSLDDDDENVPMAASAAAALGIVHDPHAVKLCASLLTLLEQLKQLAAFYTMKFWISDQRKVQVPGWIVFALADTSRMDSICFSGHFHKMWWHKNTVYTVELLRNFSPPLTYRTNCTAPNWRRTWRIQGLRSNLCFQECQQELV